MASHHVAFNEMEVMDNYLFNEHYTKLMGEYGACYLGVEIKVLGVCTNQSLYRVLTQRPCALK